MTIIHSEPIKKRCFLCCVSQARHQKFDSIENKAHPQWKWKFDSYFFRNFEVQRGKHFSFYLRVQQFSSFTKCLQNIVVYFSSPTKLNFFRFEMNICIDTQTLFHFNFVHESFNVNFSKPSGTTDLCPIQLNLN